ncbi:phage minor capsid protein [Lancefieldella rimae]|uniref:phage minor capsid protein n=1 Tax=Lancefieldella rimae TaxID=1383 RepID=UPI0028801485|nr:phage minor capsid protein [Lancefieldella rimae]
MNPTEEIAARLVGGAQAAYVRELSYFFLHLFGEVVRTNGAVLKGQEIADFDRLARISREEALGIYYKYRPYIEKQTRETLKRSLKATDDILIGQFIRVLGKRRHMTNLATLIGSQTAQGLYEVINRQNIALAEQQEALWYEVTAEAIARHQAGEPTKAVMERGVSKLSNSGLETIDYISGTKTTIDAALRRHIVSQANQARNRLLMQRMDEWEWDLVFVDAHFGARPTHALWQGKVYSKSGRSTEYPPLVESTGYGTVTGLCGANCYHNMVPYVPGLSQLPDTEFEAQEKLVGMTSDEYYAATQKQRRYERYIRNKKREIVSFQEVGLDATKQRLQLGTAQDKLRQWVADNHLRRDYQRERAWAVDRQPRALKANPFVVRKSKNASFSGSFKDTKAIIKIYKGSGEDISRTFEKRTQVKINFSNDFPIAVQRQIAAGVEHAFDFIGSSIKQPLYFRMNNNLKGSVLAQASRRNGAALIEVTDSFLKKPVDERIQVAFHELAHTKEWTLTTWAEWQKEVDEIIAFRSGEIDLLPQSKLNQRFEQAFLNAEVLVYYSGLDGKIEFDSGKDIECLERISPYMKGYNRLGDESSSELLAESLRFVAVNGFGKNKIADIVVKEALSW